MPFQPNRGKPLARALNRHGAYLRRTLRFGGETGGWALIASGHLGARMKSRGCVHVCAPDIRAELTARIWRDRPGTPISCAMSELSTERCLS